MTLRRELSAWNGKSVDDIQEIYDKYYNESDFVDSLLSLLDEPLYQTGATWLLKNWLSTGNKIKKSQNLMLFSRLKDLQHWESKLHILQCLNALSIVDAQKQNLEAFLRGTISDKNKFLRAWSYNGFYELSQQHPEYKEETEHFFNLAMRDEAPSVKARIRNIMKQKN